MTRLVAAVEVEVVVERGTRPGEDEERDEHEDTQRATCVVATPGDAFAAEEDADGRDQEEQETRDRGV